MDLTRLPHGLEPDGPRVRAVIETPRGARYKYTYKPDLGAFEASKLLPLGMAFPLDFGFVPSTCAEDGDPLDILVLADEPLEMGAVLTARLMGALKARQTVDGRTYRNDRLIAVAEESLLHARLKAVEDLGETFREQLLAFWINYNALRKRTFEPLGFVDAQAAAGLVIAAMA